MAQTRAKRSGTDDRVIKALSHPLRQKILVILNERVASPRKIADELGEPLGNVSYHTRMLLESDCVELVRTEPRRGALEHFYRATQRPFFGDEQFGRLPVSVRRELFGQTLERIWSDVTVAATAGGFDHPAMHVTRSPLELDAQAFGELAELLGATLERALDIHAESAGRQIERGADAEPLTSTELAMLHFGLPAGTGPIANRRARKRKPRAAG